MAEPRWTWIRCVWCGFVFWTAADAPHTCIDCCRKAQAVLNAAPQHCDAIDCDIIHRKEVRDD